MVLKTLTLYQTKIYDFSYPFSDLTPKICTPFQTVPCQNRTLFQTKKAKTIPYFRLKQLENHTLKCGTCPYSLYIGVPPWATLSDHIEDFPVHSRTGPGVQKGTVLSEFQRTNGHTNYTKFTVMFLLFCKFRTEWAQNCWWWNISDPLLTQWKDDARRNVSRARDPRVLGSTRKCTSLSCHVCVWLRSRFQRGRSHLHGVENGENIRRMLWSSWLGIFGFRR